MMSLFMSDMICKWFTDGYWYMRGVGVAGGLKLEYGIGCATSPHSYRTHDYATLFCRRKWGELCRYLWFPQCAVYGCIVY